MKNVMSGSPCLSRQSLPFRDTDGLGMMECRARAGVWKILLP